MFKRFFVKTLVSTLSVLLVLTGSVVTSSLPASAAGNQQPEITLNGTVLEGEPGYINSKSTILSSAAETKVNYRLVPDYSSGAATDVIVKIFLPSLEYIDGDYQTVTRGTPTPLGIQGTVSAGGGWNVISDTTVRGGPIIMQYDGDLGAGTNPAFDILLTTYNDGTDGVYGSIPEGTTFELNGYVSYEMFNRIPGSSWETSNQLDNESRVSVISSDLTWDAKIESLVKPGETDLVPIWDRYQYVDYVYEIENTSDNLASNIDGYSVTFDIDSKDSNVNGIIPFDINRWIYNEDGSVSPNEDINRTSGLFVGKPGEGGVLIYDITDWDGDQDSLGDPIPYSYSGSGMIIIDRENGENKTPLTPDTVEGATLNKYLVSLPLSRQGFPSPPAMFKIRAVTNVLFAKTANWSKTHVVQREIANPIYGFEFDHTTKQEDVVYGYETFNELSNLRNNSNAPIFEPKVKYTVEEDFKIDRVVYEFPTEFYESFENSEIRYNFINEDDEEVSRVLKDYVVDTVELNEEESVTTLTFDVSELKDVEWDNTLLLSIVEMMDRESDLDLNIKVYGAPYEIKVIESSAKLEYIEKIASNDDWGQETTYTEVVHEVIEDSEFNVIYPEEVIPNISFKVDDKNNQGTVKYDERAIIDVIFGTNNTIAENSTTIIEINTVREAMHDVELSLHPELFENTENLRITYETMDEETGEFDLSEFNLEEIVKIQLESKIAKIIINTDEMTTPMNGVKFISLDGVIKDGLNKQHIINGEIRTYQPLPYDKDTTRTNTATIDITLPKELVPTVESIGIYGDRKTSNTTHVGYESLFQIDFQLNTGGVNSPEAVYEIDMLNPTKSGELNFNKIKLTEDFLNNTENYVVIFEDNEGNTQEFTEDEILASEITLDNISKIKIDGENFNFESLTTIAQVEFEANIEIGSTQTVRAFFEGSQEVPYVDNKTAVKNNVITVRETRTTLKLEGVNQVNQGLGTGNTYSVDVYRCWSCGTTYARSDYTLDQGYKSLGGFTSTVYRPTATYDNNNQKVSLDVELPYQHFDLYYLKINDKMKDYIDDVEIYRIVDGQEELWKVVPGDEWIENSQEGSGFWRIGTARPSVDDERIFETHNDFDGVENHPYYKDAWDEDVHPEAPVNRVNINLSFERLDNNALPQMSGTNEDVVEYMGRFHSSTVGGSKSTNLKSTDTFGVKNELERTDSKTINSIVHSSFAQTRTGAHDNTSTRNKVITMGGVGEYLASVWNINNGSWAYSWAHGPDVYIPSYTEHDEWARMYDPSSFHDKMIYEFVYPASPNDDETYNLDPSYFIIPASTSLKYATSVLVYSEDNQTVVDFDFNEVLSSQARFNYDNTAPLGITDNEDGTYTVSLGEETYPGKFEIIYEHIPGWGDKSAEISGLNQDTLGSNLNEVDVRIGGIVNGNRALVGTTNIYREQGDTEARQFMHTSNATLTGYTPRLGASLNMGFDKIKTYDYKADGITPTDTRVNIGIRNNSEADIKEPTINFTPDSRFRSRLIEIPKDVFEGSDWSVESVELTQDGVKTNVELSQFTLNNETGNYELDLVEMFENDELTTNIVNVNVGGEAELQLRHINNITVKFTPNNDSVRLWGSLAQAESEETLLRRMTNSESDLFVTGVWVDETVDGSNWLSKPTFVNVNTKASNEVLTSYTSFNANASVTSYQPIYTGQSGTNNGINPSITINNTNAPMLYNRVARLQTHGTHLNEDNTIANSTHLFYDEETDEQINYTNINVGDTTKVLYELRNIGVEAESDTAPGSLPVFKPKAHIVIPEGLEFEEVIAVKNDLMSNSNIADQINDVAYKEITSELVEITNVNNKRIDVVFDTVLDDGESVYFLVKFKAINDYDSDNLYASQNKTIAWNVYTLPAHTHQFMSYDSVGVSSNRISGSTGSFLSNEDLIMDRTSLLTNTVYRYSNPNELRIASDFDEENISGKTMKLTVQNIKNETLHDNTNLELFIKLDRSDLGGFELTSFPNPTYPAEFNGSFSAPEVFFKFEENWINTNNFDSELHNMNEINELKVDYGITPAEFNNATFQAPNFQISGIGHWKTAGAANTKSYNIYSEAQIVLTNIDSNDVENAKYAYTTNSYKTVWKAIPQIEFNIQSFDELEQANATYNGSNTGKVNYIAGDEIHYRLTARNHSTEQGINTNTPYGKAPFLNPVIIDKIPVYLEHNLDQYITNGVFDVESAIANNDITVRILDSNGHARNIELPTVTVENLEGFDVGGAQTFNNLRKNDGWGRPSTAEPSNLLVNPANEIDFQVFTYTFENESIDRNEQLEIIYSTTAREDNLPYATYSNGKSVFAPMFSWYSANQPVSSNARNTSMDMASLLHDAGITGNKGHEMTSAEFLASSYSWQPGNNGQRRNPTNNSNTTQSTWYDSSANKMSTHLAYLRETSHNSLYTGFTSGVLDENFDYAAKIRVNDGKIDTDERILWAQDGVQLNRAWLYGASEMLPDVKRGSHGTSNSNFYEHDGSLNSYNINRLGYTPYVEDNYTYAVELHEEFTVRLHASNLGDRSIESGLEYIEILPLGITPYDENGDILGIHAFNGNNEEISSTFEIIQTPTDDKGYRAPANSQEAGSYTNDKREDMIPYVVKIKVEQPLSSMFNAPSSAVTDKHQHVDIRVRVYEELPPNAAGLSYWHDEFTLTTIEEEEYIEIYDNSYGAFSASINSSNTHRYPNDGMLAGVDINDTAYRFANYTSYYSFEPWGRYIRGLNAQGVTTDVEGKPAITTGDQLAMRKPTLRVWANTTKDSHDSKYHSSIGDFTVDIYEEFTINSIVENQQLEVLPEYNRRNSGYNRYSGDNLNADVWVNAPQTIGGARGSWFEPTNTISLPYGIAPVMTDGSFGRYYNDIDSMQDIEFTASINNITFNSSTPVKDVSDAFDVHVELVEDDKGKRFLLHFIANDEKAATVNYGQSLVISPRVVTIDTPNFGADENTDNFEEILTFAHSKRPVFNPIISQRYQTGSVPSQTTRDRGVSSAPNNVPSNNGQTITNNDRTRLDSFSTWNNNFGVNRVTERLVSETKEYTDETEIVLNSNVNWITTANEIKNYTFDTKHEAYGAFGGTILNTRHASITNNTTASLFDKSVESDLTQVDSAGKYWYITDVENSVVPNVNPYEEYKTSGEVMNSRFVITQYVINFAEVTGEVRIKLGDDVLTRDEFEALGYSIEQVSVDNTEADEMRNRIQWIVTPPQNRHGNYGHLANNDSFKFMYQVQLVDGYEDTDVTEETAWNADELKVDSYISLITDDKTVIAGDQKPEDFITQSASSMKYRTFESDENAASDIDDNGSLNTVYAKDDTIIEILKPQAEIRVNTSRPRIPYSNGLSGEPYFNSSDIIEYINTYVKNTGSGLKELVVENILPTHESNDPSVPLSTHELLTNTLFVTSGKWELPESMIEILESNNVTVDEAFKTFVYISHETAEENYESGDWTLLNPGGSSIYTNERFEIPVENRMNLKKVRVVVKAMDPENFLVPTGTRLDIDADPETVDIKEEVIETDPTNKATETFPNTVLDNAITIGMRISSDTKSTLFIHNTSQIWGNYVADRMSKLDEDFNKAYLTPSRPVINVKYDTLYYRSDNTRPKEESFGWSDITTIAPKSSPHLKFSGQFINSDKTMWNRDEDIAYSEDTLINPFVSFQLPTVMESGGDFTYVPQSEIDETHPLSNDHRSMYSLTSNETNLWTWKLLRADGSEPSEDSYVVHTDMYAGPWPGFDRNIVSVWFEGIIYPGDMIVVEFIGAVDAYSPGADSEDLKSRAVITNNTGLLNPLNSIQNNLNRLGYSLDTNDFNDNKMTNDRLVFSEKNLFQYETYDNFGKRKVSYSDLNMAGTVSPESTPVSEGGEVTFKISVDNSMESTDRPYPYPIMYDVLPHIDDTTIYNENIARNSMFTPLLSLEDMSLEAQGANKKTYNTNEYTVFVGPFTKQGQNIVEAPMLPAETVMSEAFYDSLNVPGQASATRDANFVPLEELQDNQELISKARTLLVMFNNPNEVLPGQNKLEFTYKMKALQNAPVFLEQFNTTDEKDDYSFWNSFVATQRVDRFIPQESNNAGAYVTQQADKTYIGNYIWNDVNYDSIQNEGTLITDSNGRSYLQPSIDLDYDGVIDDPGINGVKVTLLTENGYNVDNLGRAIHKVGNDWLVVDETTGITALDEVFGLPIHSDGPLVTMTETDFNGNNGYYIFSNIPEGSYRVMFEFPSEYERFSITTAEVFKNNNIEIFDAGESVNVPAINDASVLSAITTPAVVDLSTTDEERMSFDLGIAEKVKLGGTIFKESPGRIDGYQTAGESGIPNYHVYLKDMNGDTVIDPHGDEMIAITNSLGEYEFDLLPIDRQYYIEVTDESDSFNYETVVSPIIHNINPFEQVNDNDGYNEKDTEIVRSNILNLPLEELFRTSFADRNSVSVGFYDKTIFGVIGNRVWDDLNRDGIQDENEPGVSGQTLHLEQYILVDNEWEKTSFSDSATTNNDGYYYFTEVPSIHVEGSGADRVEFETKYQVVVNDLVKGYTFTPAYVENNIEVDSNFFRNGTMHETTVVGDNLISVVELINGIPFGLDNNTIDLGLVSHAKSSLSGEIFIDSNEDGSKFEESLSETIYNATLEVKHNNNWVIAQHDSNGHMVEPFDANSNHASYIMSNVNNYNFEELHIINSDTLEPYEYRVVITQIPLWQDVTELRAVIDSALDNDFTLTNRTLYNTAISEEFIVGVEVDELIPMETFIDSAPVINVDLGLIELEQTANIGDYIWYDANENGLQDSDELGVPGVRVVLNKLVDNELIYVSETVTDENGYYDFEAPVSNYDKNSDDFNEIIDYVIEFNMTSRQSLTDFKVGDNEKINSKFMNLSVNNSSIYDNNISDVRHTAISEVIKLAEIDSNNYVLYNTVSDNLDIDAGVITHDTVRAIGDTVYNDVDQNGIQNDGEEGISGLTVKLYKFDKASSAWVPHEDLDGKSSTVTNDSGNYEFVVEVADLEKSSDYYRTAEEYRVMIEAPAHMRLVEINNEFSYRGSIVDGIANEKPFSYVWTDTIELVDTVSGEVDLPTAVDHLTADAGFSVYNTEVNIGGRMWDDVNNDGIQSDSENPIIGEVITLWENINGVWTIVEDVNGNSTAITSINGEYLFTVAPTYYEESSSNFLQPREYKITANRDGWQKWSPLHVGTNKTIDSDIMTDDSIENSHRGITPVFDIFDTDSSLVDVSSVRNDVEMDIGVSTYDDRVIIGGRAWDDVNANGIQDDNENPLDNKEVSLWRLVDSEWVKVEDLNGEGVKTTDSNGNYRFVVAPTNYDNTASDYLEPYVYRITSQREGWQIWSPLNVGEDNTVDSDIEDNEDFGNIHTGVTHGFSISDNENNVIIVESVRNDIEMDIGVTTYDNQVIIGGIVWDDVNENGILEDDEQPRVNQEVSLWKWDNVDEVWVIHEDLNKFNSITTNINGEYRFVVAPTNYDYNADDYLEQYRYKVTIERDGYELFSPVSVEENDGVMNTVLSSANTQWSDNLHLGYSRDYITSDVGAQSFVDVSTVRNDVNDYLGLTRYEQTATLGGVIWHDENMNNIREDEEQLLRGRSVELWRLSGDEWIPTEDINGVSIVETDERGSYEFEVNVIESYDYESVDYLRPIEYRVVVEREGFEKWASPFADEESSVDSDVVLARDYAGMPETRNFGTMGLYDLYEVSENGLVDVTTLVSDHTKDAGVQIFRPTVNISGVVWIDSNEDGEAQLYESTLSDREVRLWENIDGNWVNVEDVNGVSSVITNEDGAYNFEVYPTHYDDEHESYMKERVYKTTTNMVDGHRFSEAVMIDSIDDQIISSLEAELITLDDEGEVDVELSQNDRTLDFGFVEVPTTPTSESNSVIAFSIMSGIMLFGIFAIISSNRNRKQKHIIK